MPEQVLGTPHYMSPEQTIGAHDVDYRADIFSLGVCLFHAATGQLPFNGQGRAEVTNAIRNQPFPRGRVWPDLDPILERALQKNPAERWSSFEELEQALRNASSGPAPEMAAPPMRMGPRTEPQAPAVPVPPVDTTSRVPQPDAEGQPSNLVVWPYMVSAGLGLVGLLLLAGGTVGVPLGFILMLVGGGLAIATATLPTTGSRAARSSEAARRDSSPLWVDPAPLLVPPAPVAAQVSNDPGLRIRYRLNGLSMVSKPSSRGQIVIGRLPEAHVVVPDDARVSGRHATISPLADGTYQLNDHSSNGTWVGGTRITNVVIAAGAEFRVGSTVLQIDGPL
jgi:serine/threonine protein kinase